MRIDSNAEARRLLSQFDDRDLDDLVTDPVTAVEVLFDVPVSFRPPSPPGEGCAVDGTYHPGPPARILVSDDVTMTRQRFTVLHELGHHLIEFDDRLNDLAVDDSERRDEDICNEIAANLLLPDTLIDQKLPTGSFTAEDVAALFDVSQASRMACCVAAARRLRLPGCIILGTARGLASFSAHNSATPWRIARETAQGEASLLVRAAESVNRKARGVTQVQFASGNRSGNVHGDAFMADDGWVYQVVVADSHSPWKKGLNLGLTDLGPAGEEIECGVCGEASMVWTAPCRKCGDRICPSCSQCSCRRGPEPRFCISCTQMKPPHLFADASEICIDCE